MISKVENTELRVTWYIIFMIDLAKCHVEQEYPQRRVDGISAAYPYVAAVEGGLTKEETGHTSSPAINTPLYVHHTVKGPFPA